MTQNDQTRSNVTHFSRQATPLPAVATSDADTWNLYMSDDIVARAMAQDDHQQRQLQAGSSEAPGLRR